MFKAESAVRAGMPKPVEPQDLTAYAFLSAPSLSPDGAWAALSVHRALLEKDEYEGNVWMVPLDGGAARQLTTAGKDSGPRVSPDGKRIAFTSRREMGKDDKGNALYVIPADGGEARLVLRRKEGISGIEWSPDGSRILFLSPVGEEQDDVKTIRRINFWFNDKGFIHSLRNHAFLVDAAGGEPKQITQGEFDVTEATASHDGTRVAYLAATDDRRPYLSDLFVLDVATGAARKITNTDMEISHVVWSPDDRRLLFHGDRLPSGFASHERLWLVDAAGGTPRCIEDIDRNKANSLNCDVRMGGVDYRAKWVGDDVYFAVAEGGAVHLYALHLPDGKARPILEGRRSVEAFDVRAGRVAFVSMEDAGLPEFRVLDGTVRTLTSFNAAVPEALDLRSPEPFTFRASDGATLEGWFLRPAKEGKVPTVLYIHGGPKTAFGYSYMHEFQVFAAKGYAVLYVNPRGSDGYAEAFADIRGAYGERDYQDLMEAVDAAAKVFPSMDLDRLAVAGGSYGGFMTNWVVTHTGRFKAAVTDRCIASWVSFFATSDIGPYFTKDQVGVDPWEKEELILAKSPLRYVKDVTTPLMIVHSLDDLRCWHVEALEMFTALRYLGKEAEMVLFPKENHDLSRGGKPKHRVARLQAYLRWFNTHLG